MALLEERGPAMAGGIRVLPDFNGNRSPLANPAARGAIEGLSLDASFDSLAVCGKTLARLEIDLIFCCGHEDSGGRRCAERTVRVDSSSVI
jgi:hypothetical protein